MITDKFSSKFRMLFWCVVIFVFFAALPIDFLQELEQKYGAYREKYPTAKINLIFNQPTFSPGDTAFFSAWYLTEELLAIKGDHIVTLDLLNGNGNTVQKIRFKVKSGRGNNQIVLRTDLPPAEYKFVAYTDWIRNFGESWYYQKRIQIVSRKQLHTQASKDNVVTFYAEGGNLIEEVLGKVVVLGAASSELIVKDSNHSEVARVSLDSTGVGSFFITPRHDQTYYTNWPTLETKWVLPKALHDGLSVKMDIKDTCEMLLSLPPDSKWINKELYSIVTSRGKIMAGKKVIIKPNETYHLQIPFSEKSDAYHQLVVFSGDKQILAERVFIPHQINKASVKLQLSPTAKQRQSISFTVGLMDNLGYPIESDLSITVLQKNLFANYYSYNSFYWSDLPDVMDRVGKFGFKNLADLNDFLITQKWQRTRWNAILENQNPAMPYPFQSLITITGHVASKTTGLPPPDSTVVISYLQKNTVGYEAYAIAGKFQIPILFDFWGDDQIFLTLHNKFKILDSDYNITIAKDSLGLQDRWSSSETSKTSAYGEFAFNKQIITNSYSFFGRKQSTSIEAQGLNNILEEEFQGADATINIADYVLFPTMEDLLREVVPFVQFQQRGSKQNIRMSFRYEKSVKVYGDDPLYIIDGFMCKNTPYFLSIKPENLLTIKGINNPNKLDQLGKLGENGIIFVESKKGNLFSPVGNNIFPLAGQSRAVNFFETDYLKPNKLERVPDLRSNYYWTPALKVGKLGSTDVTFFASDDTGPITIHVEGLTKDGIPFKAVDTINVEYNPTKN
ncbi:MAG: hypothetical protein AABY93_14930 [Bacteroidota bacterium]